MKMRHVIVAVVLIIACVCAGYIFSDCRFDATVEEGAFDLQAEIYMDAGLCQEDADCPADYPTCYALGEIGICVDCYEDEEEQQSICELLLAFD